MLTTKKIRSKKVRLEARHWSPTHLAKPLTSSCICRSASTSSAERPAAPAAASPASRRGVDIAAGRGPGSSRVRPEPRVSGGGRGFRTDGAAADRSMWMCWTTGASGFRSLRRTQKSLERGGGERKVAGNHK